MNGIVKAIIIGILESLVRAYQFTRTAISADRDPVLLRRAGSRIRKWVQQSRLHPRGKPDQGGPELQDEGLSPDQRRMDTQ